jgi:hypothetical protein
VFSIRKVTVREGRTLPVEGAFAGALLSPKKAATPEDVAVFVLCAG